MQQDYFIAGVKAEMPTSEAKPKGLVLILIQAILPAVFTWIMDAARKFLIKEGYFPPDRGVL